MTNTITIPPAALEAAHRAYVAELETGVDPVQAACCAMLRSWPGMNTTDPQEKWHRPYIILPLSQEPEA